MSYNQSQLREVIRIVLTGFDPRVYSASAVEQLMFTCAAESNFGEYLYQDDGDPEIESNLALGLFQMEAFTFNDIQDRVIMRRYPEWERRKPIELITDLRLAIIMARMKYWSVPSPLPAADNVMGMARYWKRHYNTWMGAGTIKGGIEKYERYCR